jgi:ubiquinone/menaquinone biosynthesis C-methylase UbiE
MKVSTKQNWEAFWQKKNNLHEVYSNTDRVARNLVRVTNLQNKKVLEIGAGTGRDSLNLVSYGAEVYQLDYASNALKLMREVAQVNGVNIQFIGGDAFGLPFADGTFDIVFHQGLLEHFREPRATQLLEENIRVLKNGGMLLIDVPQCYHLYTVMKHILIAFNVWFAGWEREFSARELEKKLTSLGLVPIRTYGEWMYPSLLYRIVREVLLKIGIKMPLYPRLFTPLTHLRQLVRESLIELRPFINTSLAIGVIARK